MRIRWTWAILSGLVGASAMVALLTLVRLIGLTEMNLGLFLGSALTRELSLGTWLLGFAIHSAMGIVFAIIYAALFERWDGASWWQGMIIALPHILVAGAMVWGLGLLHPLVPQRIEDPDYLFAGFGAPTVITYMLMHLLFGAVVGAVYAVGRRPVLHRTLRRAPSRRHAHA